jgi:hypothetical protein
MDAIGKDVILEPAFEHRNRVVCDGTTNQDWR